MKVLEINLLSECRDLNQHACQPSKSHPVNRPRTVCVGRAILFHGAPDAEVANPNRPPKRRAKMLQPREEMYIYCRQTLLSVYCACVKTFQVQPSYSRSPSPHSFTMKAARCRAREKQLSKNKLQWSSRIFRGSRDNTQQN